MVTTLTTQLQWNRNHFKAGGKEVHAFVEFDNLTCNGGATFHFQLQKQNYKGCEASVRLRHAFCHTIYSHLLLVLFTMYAPIYIATINSHVLLRCIEFG